MAKPRALYLVRHAIAAERGAEWPDDTLRPLTPDGISRMRQAVRGFSSLGEPVGRILTSPLTRAHETADILSKGLVTRPRVEVFAPLAPGGSPAAVAAALATEKGHHALALVGHAPDLGVLAAWLIGARTPLVFKKGGMCRIDMPAWPPARNGQLIWLATPRMLRRMAVR